MSSNLSGSSSVNLNGMNTLYQMTGGINYSQIIQQLYQADLAPANALDSNIQTDQLQINDWSNISNLASTVQSDLENLSQSSTFNTFNASNSGSAVANVSATNGASPGNYTIKLKQAGTDATMTSSSNGGATGISGSLGKSVTTTTLLSQSDFSQQISNGSVSFAYNGKSYSYTVDASKSLGQTLTDLNNLTGGAVSFSYNASTNRISVSDTGSGSVTLGSSGDTSNLFSAFGLNGHTASAGGSTSSGLIGVVQTGVPLNQANLSGSLTSTASGKLNINGVNIDYNTSTDSIQSLITNINGSNAGVTASYDPISDKITLTSKTAQPITVKSGAGSNLAGILGLSGTSSAGTDWIYNVGTNSNLVSPSAQVQGVIPGVTFTLASTATTSITSTISIAQNTDTLTKAVNQFIGDFNNLYSEIQKLTGKGGALSGDPELANFASQMMNSVLGVIPSAQSKGYAQDTLMGIGISTGPIGQSPATQYSLKLNSSQLTQAFQQSPNEVQAILTGMASTLNNSLMNYTGDINSLTPTSVMVSFGQGIIQSQTDMLNSEIKGVEQEQQTMTNEANSQEQQMANQFNALQTYEQQMSIQQSEIQALGG